MNCRSAVFGLVGLGVVAWSGHAYADDQLSLEIRSGEVAQGVPQDEGDSIISKEEWRKRVDVARQRAIQARRDWRLRARDSSEEQVSSDKIATERVIRDETLQPGDIVATDKGLFVFGGWTSSDGEGRQFIPIPRQQEPTAIR